MQFKSSTIVKVQAARVGNTQRCLCSGDAFHVLNGDVLTKKLCMRGLPV